MDEARTVLEIFADRTYDVISFEESLKLHGYRHAAHCCIYSLNSHLIENKQYSTKAAVLMIFRNDGKIGFPGGLIDQENDIMEGLKRELKEEINVDTAKLSILDPYYMFTCKYQSPQSICCHFYGLKVSIEEFKNIEKDALNAEHYGLETFGLIRVPLFTMNDGSRGFPSFLRNYFIGNSKDQLLYFLVATKIMRLDEILLATNTHRK